MTITIDTDDPAPVFARLIAQIKHGVRTGALRPGDALPSVRQLAADLGIEDDAVARAYRLLELDRIIRIRARGVSVHRNARQNSARIGWSWCPLA